MLKSLLFLAVFLWVGRGLRAEDDFLKNAMKALFSVTCETEPSQYSEWTDCVWPHGDLRPLIRKFMVDAREKGCKTPPKNMMRVAYRYLGKGNYTQHPLYKKIPSQECGACGRKAQCCKKARSFLTQSFNSERCDGESPPCEVPPLSAEERAALSRRYPDITPPTDACNFRPYIEKELEKLRASPAYKFVKPLMCQILGTTKPSLRCVNDEGDRCFCCCFGFEYRDGDCVRVDEESTRDPDCN